MRKILLAVLFLTSVAAFAAPTPTPADTITTGNLLFTCVPVGCNPNASPPDFASTVPTSCSFVYDNTTNQFLSMTASWDGITLAGNPPNVELTLVGGVLVPVDQKPVYLGLIGLGPTVFWTGVCTAGLEPPFGFCGGEFGFIVGVLALGPVLPISPEFPNNAASGTVMATDLVTTPEPGATGLLLLGIGFALMVKKYGTQRKTARLRTERRTHEEKNRTEMHNDVFSTGLPLRLGPRQSRTSRSRKLQF